MSSIYISSTYEDLRDCREAVYRTLRQLGHDTVAMEDYVARDERPLERCLADVRRSDVYVGILAWRYGFVPTHDNEEQRSVTELEYLAAEEAGVPRLMFLLADEASWPVNRVDHGGARELIARFRDTVSSECTVSHFQTCEDLAKLVAVAVQRHTVERGERERRNAAERTSPATALVAALRRPDVERGQALVQWCQDYGLDLVSAINKRVAARWRARVERKRQRERERQLSRTVEQAVAKALEGHEALRRS